MSTGRYTVALSNGRKFTIEPIKERVERAPDWQNGGIQKPDGGAVKAEDSIITEAHGFRNIQVVSNPMDVIEKALREDGLL